jgi:hypothetical protein
VGCAVAGCVYLVELGEEGAEIWTAAGLILGFVGLDVVFDWDWLDGLVLCWRGIVDLPS